MAAYRTASGLFPGLHMPLLGMGCEYARMNNAPLAEQLLLSAHRICPQARPVPLQTPSHVAAPACVGRPIIGCSNPDVDGLAPLKSSLFAQNGSVGSSLLPALLGCTHEGSLQLDQADTHCCGHCSCAWDPRGPRQCLHVELLPHHAPYGYGCMLGQVDASPHAASAAWYS